MTRSNLPSLRFLAVLLVTSVALAGAGCGRKADPELPSVPSAAPPRPVGIPMGPTTPAPQPVNKGEKKPFFLDFLL